MSKTDKAEIQAEGRVGQLWYSGQPCYNGHMAGGTLCLLSGLSNSDEKWDHEHVYGLSFAKSQ